MGSRRKTAITSSVFANGIGVRVEQQFNNFVLHGKLFMDTESSPTAQKHTCTHQHKLRTSISIIHQATLIYEIKKTPYKQVRTRQHRHFIKCQILLA